MKHSLLGRRSVIAVLVCSLVACASPGKKTGIGAGIGAATGAAVGGATGGWKGAGIGAAVGAAVGGSYGNYLDKRTKELQQVAETKKTRDGLLVQLKNDLLFPTGSSQLKPEAQDEVSRVGDILAKYPQDRIRVEGHTDDVGSDASNEVLSLKRADTVRQVLLSRGVKEDQLSTRGLGETKPIASNKNASGRKANRRVELHIDVPKA